MGAVGENGTKYRVVTAESEEGCLRRRSEPWKCVVGRRDAALTAEASRHAGAKTLPPAIATGAERLREEAGDDVLAVLEVEVGATTVDDTVEDPSGVRHVARGQVAVHHHTEIAIGHQQGRHRALDERHLSRRDQALEAERRLELARTNLELRMEAHVDIRVLQNGGAAAEVRHYPHVEDPVHRCLDDRAYPSEDEAVAAAAVRIVDEEAAIRMDVTAQAQTELAVRRLH